ncbi:YcxB family protein [Actinomadura monticuli]|uniref:YcxB family protein n=1 Tax=Actinomadura monticuli TaxID=3097367 RepID=A0ABV4QJN4_9ACTN
MDITVRYQLTPDEIGRAAQRGLRSQLTAVYAVLVTVLVAGAAILFVLGETVLAVALLAGSVLGPLAGTWWMHRHVRRQLAHLCVPTTVQVTDDGYECRTDESTMAMRWSMFDSVVTTEEFWLLFVNGQPAAFLPKKAFDAAQRAEIAGFLATREGPARRPAGPGAVSGPGSPGGGSPGRR